MRFVSLFVVALLGLNAHAGYLGIAHFQNGNNSDTSSPAEVKAENYVNQSFTQYSEQEWDNGIRPRDNREYPTFWGGSDFVITITPGSMTILLNPGDPTTVTTTSLNYNSVSGFEVYLFNNAADGKVGVYELEAEYYTSDTATTPAEVQCLAGDDTGEVDFAYFSANKTVSGTIKKIVLRGTVFFETNDVPFDTEDVLKAMIAFYGN
jgi:hypothetical protein